MRQKAQARHATANLKDIFHDRKFAKEPIILVEYFIVIPKEVGQFQVFRPTIFETVNCDLWESFYKRRARQAWTDLAERF